MADKYQKDAQGNVWDVTTGKMVVKADGTAKKQHTGRAEPPDSKKIANGYKQAKPLSEKAKVEKETAQRSHTILARETIALNRSNPVDLNNPDSIQERGDWLFSRCVELAITPTIPAFLNALGIKKLDEQRVLQGEFGNSDVRSVIAQFVRALEQIAEGALVDSVSGQTGRIAELNNKWGWSQNPMGTAMIAQQNLGALISPEELKKAIAAMPQTDLTDEKKAIDVEFEIVGGEDVGTDRTDRASKE